MILRGRVERSPAQMAHLPILGQDEWSTPYVDGLSGALTRETLGRAMREIGAAVGAEQFCLADLSRSHAEQPPQVLSSNWSFDAIEIIGTATIETLIQARQAVLPGQPHTPYHPTTRADGPRPVDVRTAAHLIEFGHHEIYLLKLRAGPRRGVCILSGPRGKIMCERLSQAHMIVTYLTSRYFETLASEANDPLSERERECLYWVSEGKTTEEIAVIISVSANTVNKYIVSAIHKFGAENRAMAIAVAIRAGVI